MFVGRFALTMLLAVTSGVAAGGIIRVEFTAEFDGAEGIEAIPRRIQGSFSFDNAKPRSDVESFIGSYVQTELREFTIETELGRASVNSGQVMHFGSDHPGLINSSDLIYRVAVGDISYPSPNEQSKLEVGVDFDDLHTINIDFPVVWRPLVRLELMHAPDGDRTQRSLVPPLIQEINDAKLTFFYSSEGALLPTYSQDRLVYNVESLQIIPEPSSTTLVCIVSLLISIYSYRAPSLCDSQPR